MAFGPNKASNSGSFALATKNLGTTELTPEELDEVVKGASLLHDSIHPRVDFLCLTNYLAL